MNKRALVFFLLLAVVFTTPISPVEANNPQVHRGLDLALHMFAHIDLAGNPASNYNPDYVEMIRHEKEQIGLLPDLTEKLQPYANLINQDVILIFVLSAIPVFFSGPESFLCALQFWGSGDQSALARLTHMDQMIATQIGAQMQFATGTRDFLQKFARVGQMEYEQFYKAYWESNSKRYEQRLTLFANTWNSEELGVVRTFLQEKGIRGPAIFLSDVMHRNGRGFMFMTEHGAIVRLPDSEDDVFASYTVALHELLHNATDPVVYQVMGIDPNRRSIDPSDREGLQIHQTIEAAVIIAQYWLMEKVSPLLVQNYLGWASRVTGRKVANYQMLQASFPIPDQLEQALRNVITTPVSH